MAHIESFAVQGLAGRSGELSRTLDRHVNIFWGLNGTGKTTLLKILHAALSNETKGLESLPFESAEVVLRVGADNDKVIRRYAKRDRLTPILDEVGDGYLNGESTDDDWANDEETLTDDWITIGPNGADDPRLRATRFRHSYLPITRVSPSGRRSSYYAEQSLYARARETLSTDEVFVRQVSARWSDYNAKSLSSIRDVQQQGLANVLSILFGGSSGGRDIDLHEVEAEEAYELVNSFLREQGLPLTLTKPAFAAKFSSSQEHQLVVVEIEGVRKEVAKILEPQREFQSVIDSMYAGNKHLLLRRGGFGVRTPPIAVEVGDKSIPLESLSSGEKQLLQILLEALGAAEDTVMIDEPELSMHVDWQQRLVASMRRVNPMCQLLLATHSPEVMADVSDELVFEL